MRRHSFVSLALLGALALTGCAQSGFTAASLGAADDAFDVMGRAVLGGDAYKTFKIAPTLPKAGGQRAAVKLTYLMNDDTAHQSPQSLGMLKMMDDMPQKNVHNVVFRDGGEMGDSKLYYIQNADRSPDNVANPSSLLAPGVTEVQSNNPRVFSQIVEYAFDTYPGRKKYLQIKLKNAIQNLDIQQTLDACYDNPNYPNTPQCSAFTRHDTAVPGRVVGDIADGYITGYQNTASVTVTLGKAASEGAAGSTYWTLPVSLDATDGQGKHSYFAGCYTLRLANPAIQAAPPFEPLHITDGHLRSAKGFGKAYLPANCAS